MKMGSDFGDYSQTGPCLCPTCAGETTYEEIREHEGGCYVCDLPMVTTARQRAKAWTRIRGKPRWVLVKRKP